MEGEKKMCLPVIPYRIEREWEHAGLKCAVVQAIPGGHRCGYVRVPPGHAAHGKDYNDVSVEVHGGLTFGEIEPCAHDDGAGFWFGFDCCHAWDARYDPKVRPEDLSGEWAQVLQIHLDVAARYPHISEHISEHFWSQEEVERETEQLAEQLAAIAQSAAPTNL
jgi:hypothetical protein